MFYELRPWISIPLAILFVQCSDDQDSDAGNPLATGGFAGSTPVAGGTFGNGGLPAAMGGSVSASGGVAGAGLIGSGGAPPAGSGGMFTAAGGAPESGGAAGSIAAGGMMNAEGGDTGVDAGASGGAAGEGGDYNPCPPAGEPCKILPLGDSITFGLGFSGGYRVELFRKAVQDNKSITFVGSVMNGPSMVEGVPFPRANQGHSGWTISQIDGIVPSPALDGDPHIILLMIGTNDVAWAGAAGAPERLSTLIDGIVAEAPDALLVVAKITPLKNGNDRVQDFNMQVPGIVEESAAAGDHVVMVDMYEGFSMSMLGDGIHPNEGGYARMAEVWYEAIGGLLR